MEKTKLVNIFDRQARQYERRRKNDTQGNWRRALFKNVRGRILELAVGAGANFAYYPSNVHVTAVDFSPRMLAKAKEAAKEYGIQAELVLSDIDELDFPDDSFDAIVSTLSFCGYENPVRLMRKLNRWCKKDGEVLLMEHGVSSNRIISFFQNVVDPIAFRVIGCHQNRDILGMMQESNLMIQRVENHWMRTVHVIWAKPAK